MTPTWSPPPPPPFSILFPLPTLHFAIVSEVLAGAQGASCDDTCSLLNAQCDERALPALNSFNECPGTFELAGLECAECARSRGAEQPAQEDQVRCQPSQCLISFCESKGPRCGLLGATTGCLEPEAYNAPTATPPPPLPERPLPGHDGYRGLSVQREPPTDAEALPLPCELTARSD